MTARLVVLASGEGTNLQAVIDACDSGRLDAQVVAVGANRLGAGALTRAERAGITTFTLLAESGSGRADYDLTLATIVADHHPDLIVLAGWMRLFSMSFLGRFPGRVVNLHPALPGELPGLHAIERAHAEGEAGLRTRTGVMIHLVPDEGVDDGPVLASEVVDLVPGETVEELAERVHAVEHRLLVDALDRLIAQLVPAPT